MRRQKTKFSPEEQPVTATSPHQDAAQSPSKPAQSMQAPSRGSAASTNTGTDNKKTEALDNEAINDTNYIPDRDQLFGRDHRTYPGSTAGLFNNDWSGDSHDLSETEESIEEKTEDSIKGERHPSHDLLEDLTTLGGGNIAARAGDAADEGPAAAEKSRSERTMPSSEQQASLGAQQGHKHELLNIKSMLSQRQHELTSAIAANEDTMQQQIKQNDTSPSHVDYNHPADMSEGDTDYEKTINLIERQRSELSLVKEALLRIATGDYGVCEACGNDIPAKRLQAIPYTKYCIDCETLRERRRQPVATRVPAPLDSGHLNRRPPNSGHTRGGFI